MDGQETIKLGVFAPGVYTIKGQKEYEYTTVEDKTEITLFDHEEFEEIASLDMSRKTVTVTSEIPNTKVYVNDNQSEISITSKTEFGPVKEGIKLKGVTDFPWGKAESQSVTVNSNEQEYNDSYDLTPQPITKKETKNNIKQAINQFAKNRINALKKQNVDILSNVSDNLRKDFVYDIQGFDENHYVIGKALGTRIDFSKATYENGSGGIHLIHIPVEFHDKFDEVYSSIFGDKEGNEDLKERFQEKIITLQYIKKNNNPWMIKNIDNDYTSDNETYMTSDKVIKTKFK